MKVLCCEELKPKDLESIQKGISSKDVIEKNILDEMSDLSEKIEYMRTENIQTLYWLIKTGKLKIKTCVTKNDCGIYHEKYGLIYRPDRNSCFIGGFNLSLSGHLLNSETCHGFIDEPKTFEYYEKAFQTTWGGDSPIVDCYDFPEAAKHVILKEFEKEWEKRVHKPIGGEISVRQERLYESLWNHQKRGFDAYFNSNCNGIVQMATGTGKTKLALAIYEKMHLDMGLNNCILVAGRNNLLNQWVLEIASYFSDHRIIRRYDKYNELADLDDYIDDNYPIFLLTTYGLLADVEKGIRTIKKRSLLICDEVHNLGADACERDLRGKISQFTYRLGLSATPERIYDEEGTSFIMEEVGPIVFEYSLREALNDGILCPFRYAPIKYLLTEDERIKIRNLVRKRSVTGADGKPAISDADFRRLVSDVYKKSLQKIRPFEAFLNNHPDVLNRSIVFVHDKEYGEKIQIMIQNNDPDFKYHTFYDDDDDSNLGDFSNDKLRCLVTCNKISEGISINDVTTVVLFSTAKSPTETLQRIGRCLRKDPNNPNKIATIVDFIEEDRVLKDGSPDKDRYDFLCDLCKEVIE